MLTRHFRAVVIPTASSFSLKICFCVFLDRELSLFQWTTSRAGGYVLVTQICIVSKLRTHVFVCRACSQPIQLRAHKLTTMCRPCLHGWWARRASRYRWKVRLSSSICLLLFGITTYGRHCNAMQCNCCLTVHKCLCYNAATLLTHMHALRYLHLVRCKPCPTKAEELHHFPDYLRL